MFNVRNAEESPEAFHFKCLHASLCLCSPSPVLEDGYSKCSVEFKLGFEADVSENRSPVFYPMVHVQNPSTCRYHPRINTLVTNC